MAWLIANGYGIDSLYLISPYNFNTRNTGIAKTWWSWCCRTEHHHTKQASPEHANWQEMQEDIHNTECKTKWLYFECHPETDTMQVTRYLESIVVYHGWQ